MDDHSLRPYKELGIPVSYSIKDFTNRPLDELTSRSDDDEFQRAEVAIKYDKLQGRGMSPHYSIENCKRGCKQEK